MAVLVVLEIRFAGAHHPITAMRVAQGHGDRPFHLRVVGEVFKAVPANIVGGIADAEYRIQQQVDRARTGANDQVGAADGAGKTGAGFGAHPLDGQQQAYRQGDGEGGQQCGKATVGQAGQR